MKSLIFSSPLAPRVLDGSKTMTRRLLNWPKVPDWHDYDYEPFRFVDGWPHFHWNPGNGLDEIGPLKSPLKVGDRFYMRETYWQFGHWEPLPGVKTKKGRQKWAFIPATGRPKVPWITFIEPSGARSNHKDPSTNAWHKRLARFMPAAYARFIGEIIEVRVEKLNEISEEDAIKEGVRRIGESSFKRVEKLNDKWCGPAGECAICCDTAKEAFSYLWTSIHGTEPNSWAQNPWVFVYTWRKAE